MNTFDIETFDKNKNQFKRHIDTLDNSAIIDHREYENEYYEVIKTKDSYFEEINWYFKNGNLKSKGLFFYSSFKKGIWAEYDENGILIKETDYDKGFNYTWENLLELLEDRKVNIKDTVNTTIRKDEGRWHVWYVEGLYVYNIFIDGKTGEILLDDKDEFEEGS